MFSSSPRMPSESSRLFLLGAQVGQQVGDAEGGVAHVLAHLDGDGGAVGAGKGRRGWPGGMVAHWYLRMPP